MRKKFLPWILFVIVFVATILSLVYVQQRNTSILQGGSDYQWPVTLERKSRWVASDYLTLNFLGSRTTWTGAKLPADEQIIFVNLGVQPNGIVYVKSATDSKPTEGLYLRARVSKFYEGIVEFKIPYDRFRVDLKKVNPTFYSGKYKGILLATLKIKDGKAIVTGVYSKGIPLEIAVPSTDEAIKEKEPFLLPTGTLDEKGARSLFNKDKKLQNQGTSEGENGQ